MKKKISPKFRNLRVTQLSRSLGAFSGAAGVDRPRHGWLRAIREALGLSAPQLAKSMHANRSLIQQLENAEAENRITLSSLRRVAEAMGCKLVYAIVPESGTLGELVERRAHQEASRRIATVQHSMTLEDQAVTNIDEIIAEEAKRILDKK